MKVTGGAVSEPTGGILRVVRAMTNGVMRDVNWMTSDMRVVVRMTGGVM